MTKELTDEEVFTAQPPKKSGVMSDEEVFGTGGEISDKEVFGIPDSPQDQFMAAAKKANEAKKVFEASAEEFEKFSALPLTEADEPERIRLYAGARNAQRVYSDEINNLEKIRPAYEQAVEKEKESEIASIEGYRDNPITAPVVDSLLEARERRDTAIQELSMQGLTEAEYREGAKKIIEDYASFMEESIVGAQKTEQENKGLLRDLLNDMRRVYASGDRRYAVSEAIGGVFVGTNEYENLFSIAREMGDDYENEIISRTASVRDKARGAASAAAETGILKAPFAAAIAAYDLFERVIGGITTGLDSDSDEAFELEQLKKSADAGNEDAAAELSKRERKVKDELLKQTILELPLEERQQIRKDFIAKKQEERLAGLDPERRQSIIDAADKIMESTKASLFDPESARSYGAALPDGSVHLTAKGKMDIDFAIDRLVEDGQIPEARSQYYKNFYNKQEDDRSRAARGAALETNSFKQWLGKNPEYADKITTDEGATAALDEYEKSHNTVLANLFDIVPSLLGGVKSYVTDASVGARLAAISASDISDEEKAEKMFSIYVEESNKLMDQDPKSFMGGAAEVTGNFGAQAAPMVTIKLLSLFPQTRKLAQPLMGPARAYTMAHMGAIYASQGYMDAVDRLVQESGYSSLEEIQEKDPNLALDINRKGQAAMVDAAAVSVTEQLPIEGLVASIGSKATTPTLFRRFIQGVLLNPAQEVAQEIIADTILQSAQVRYSTENKDIEMMSLEEIAQMYVGVLPITGATAVGARMADRRKERLKELIGSLDAQTKLLQEAADSSAQAAERAAALAPEASKVLKDAAERTNNEILDEAEAKAAGPTGQTVPESRTIAEAIRDKDTFVYQGMRGAITEEDGEVVFRPFGTQNKYIVPVAPDQTIGEIEELQWQRRGQRRQTGEAPIEPTAVPNRAEVVERNPVVTEAEFNEAPDTIPVPQALVEIEKSPILNFLADLFDTGDSRATQTEKAEYKSGKRKGQTYEKETETPVTELPEYYRQATPDQLDQAKRLIDAALRLIDTMDADPATKDALAEHFLLLDQDITNYEQNPEYRKYRQERGWQVSATGQTSEVPTTASESAAAERELEQRVRAEVEARERERSAAARVAVTPPEVPAGTRIKAAAYAAPDGTIFTADSHLNAMQKAADAGKITQEDIAKKQKAISRETSEFGFSTDSEPFITRDQAETLAKTSGQLLTETPETGRIHSNEVALDDFTPNVDAPPYIARAIVNREPISVEDVDRAGVELPKGWKVDGDVYVYTGEDAKDTKPVGRLDAFARIFSYAQDYAEKNPDQAENLRNKVGLIVKRLQGRGLFNFPVNFQDAVITGIQNRLFSALNRNVPVSKISVDSVVRSALSDAKKTYPVEYERLMDSFQGVTESGQKIEDVLTGKISKTRGALTPAEKKVLEEEKRRTAAIQRRLAEKQMAQRIVGDFEETLNDEERLAFEFIKAIERSKNDPANKSKRRQADQARERLEDAVEDYEVLVSSIVQRFAELAERISGQRVAPKAPKIKQTFSGQRVAAEQQEKVGVLAEVDAELDKTENLTEAEKDARAKTEDPTINNVGAWIKSLSKNDPLRRLMETILKADPSVANLPIQYVAAINGKYDGFYDPKGKRLVLPQKPTQDLKLLIGHEVVHAATLDKARFYDSRQFDQLTTDELNVFRELDKIRNNMLSTFGKGNARFSEIMGIADSAERGLVAAQAVANGEIGGELYALVNMAEFLANSINNAEFQKALDSVDPNIFRQIWNLLRKLFYSNREPSASVNALWDSIAALSRSTKVDAATESPAPSFVLPEFGIKNLPIIENKSDLMGLIDRAVVDKRMSIATAIKFKEALNIIPEEGYRGAQVLFSKFPTRDERKAMELGFLRSLIMGGQVAEYVDPTLPPIIYISTSKWVGDPIRTFIHENAHIILNNILTPSLVRQAKEIYDSSFISRQAPFIANYSISGVNYEANFGEWFAESMTEYYERRIAETGLDIEKKTLDISSYDIVLGKIYKKIFDKFSNEKERTDALFDGIDAALAGARQKIARLAEEKIAPASVSIRSSYVNATKNGDHGQAKVIEEDAINKVLNVLTPDLLKKEYRQANKTNSTYGHCYACSEALYHMLGGSEAGLLPARGRDANGVVHWWLKSKDGRVVDPTATQYTSIGLNPPYENGKGGGFLTKEPSRRAQTIIDRVNGVSMGQIAPSAVAPVPSIQEWEEGIGEELVQARQVLKGKAPLKLIKVRDDLDYDTDMIGGTHIFLTPEGDIITASKDDGQWDMQSIFNGSVSTFEEGSLANAIESLSDELMEKRDELASDAYDELIDLPNDHPFWKSDLSVMDLENAPKVYRMIEYYESLPKPLPIRAEPAPAAITPKQDADYMAAVDRGDMETAQRMVDEAAKESGFSLNVYHGTTESGKKDILKRGVDMMKSHKGYFGQGFYTGTELETAKQYAQEEDLGGAILRLAVSDNARLLDLTKSEDWDTYSNLTYRGRKVSQLISLDGFADIMQSVGIDGLYDRSFGGWIFYRSDIFKNSEIITRDNNGNVIPLSQRFDVTRPEIAFSAIRIPPEEGGTFPPATSARLEELGVRSEETVTTGTDRTYKRILEYIKPTKGMSVLDFGSGLGHGLKLLKDEAKRIGFEALGYEPMWRPDRKAATQAPDYIGFESLDLIPDNSQDVIINNAVLNVVPEDTRAAILQDMYSKLKSGGTLFLQARSWTGDVSKLLSNPKNIVVGPREIFVTQKQTFQKGFTPEELTSFVESQLPDAEVVRTPFGGVGLAITKPVGIAPAAVKISKVSDEFDGSRVGTAQQNLGIETTQDTNVSIDTINEKELTKQMEDLVVIDGAMELPRAITSIQDPVKKRDAFIEFVVDNLVTLYNAFPKELRAAATRWYDGARLIAQDMSKEFGISNEQAAGILAAFSPMKEWFQNIELGIQFAKVFKGHRKTKIDKVKYAKGIEEVTNSASGLTKAQKVQAMADRAALLSQLEGRSIDGLWSEASRNEAKALKIKQSKRLTKKQYQALPEIQKARELRELASWAVRVIATQEYGLEYKVYTPDGNTLDLARNKDGSSSTLVWQSAAFIEKALSIAYDGSPKNISNNLGKRHKIRSFYNNIIAPNSPYEDVTVDTHAVNAAVLFPMGNTGKMVGDAFGDAGVGGGGNRGTYWLFREAYIRAAKIAGVQPRQMQSITWEAIRGLFPDDIKSNKSFVAEITNIWKNASNVRAARNKIIARGIRIPDWASAYTGGGRGVAGSVAPTGGVAGSKANIARGLRNRVRSGDFGIAPAAIDPNTTPDPDSEDNSTNEAAAIAASRADAKVAQESIVGHSILADEIPAELREELEAVYENGMTFEEFINSGSIALDESFIKPAIALWLDLNGGLMPTVKDANKKIDRLENGSPEAEAIRMLNRAFDIYNNASDAATGGREVTYKIGDIVATWLRSGLGEAALRNAIVQFTNLDVPIAVAIAEDTVKQYGIQQQIADSKERARVRMDRAIPAITQRQKAEKERMIRLEQAAGTIDSMAEAIKLAYDVNVNKARVDRATEKKQIQEQLRQAKAILREVVPREYLGEQLTALERASGLDGLKKIVEVAQDALNKARVDYATDKARKAFDRASKAVKAGTLTPEAEAILRGFVDQYTKSGMSEKTKSEIQAVLDEYTNDPINALKRLTTTKSGKEIYAIDKYMRRKGDLAAIKIDKSLGLDALREITNIVNSTMHMDKMAKGELLFNKRLRRQEWKDMMIKEIAAVKSVAKEKAGFGPKLGGFKWNVIFKGARVENILRGLGLNSMRQFVYENLAVDAYNDELMHRHKLKKQIESYLKQITGLEIGTKDYDNYSKQLFDVVGIDQSGERTTIQIRRSELIDVVASLRDPNNLKKAVRAGGFVIDRLRGSAKGDTIQITPESYIQLQDSMSDSDLAMVNFVVSLYNNELFTLLNDASIQTHGHGIKKTEGTYYPRNAFRWDRVTETSKDLDYMEYYNSRVDSVGHLKERVDEVNARLVAVDFLSRLDYHVTNDSRIAAYLPIVQDINSILKDSDVMRPLEMKVGEDVVFNIGEMVRQQTVPLPGLRDNLINTLIGNAGVGILGFKIHAAIQNPVGIPIAMAYYGKDGFKYALQGLGNLRYGFDKKEYAKMEAVLQRYTPYYSERYGQGGFIQEFTSGMAGGPSDSQWRKSMEDKSLSWLELTDKIGALARYKVAIEVIKDRTDLKEGTEDFNRAVAREWNLMMFRSENTSHGADRTGWFLMSGKAPLFKAFIMFQSAVSKQYSLFAEAVIQAQQGGRQNLEEAAMKMSFVGMSVYMSLAISKFFYGILFPPDDEEEKKLSDYLAPIVSAPLAIVPVLGNTFQRAVSGWFSPRNMQKPMQIDLISSFIFGTLESLNLGAKALREMGEGDIDTKTGDPKWWNTSYRALEKGLGMLGIATKTPIAGIAQSLKFVKRLGERTWDGIAGDLPSDESFQKKLSKVKKELASQPTTQEYAKIYFAVTENNQKKFNRAVKDLLEKNPKATRSTMLSSIRRRPEFLLVTMVERGDVKIGEHGITRDEYLSKRSLRSSMEQLAISMWRESQN